MSKFKVAITDREYEDIDNELRILSRIDAEVVDCQLKDDEESLIQKIKDCDGIIIQYAKMNRHVIESLERCKVIAKYAIGVDGIDFEAANKKNIAIVNVPDYCIDEVSTHAVGLLLETARKIGEISDRVKNGEWFHMGYKFNDMSNQIVGVIGYGKIAAKFVDKIKPFVKEVWVCSNHMKVGSEIEKNVYVKSFDEIIAKADYISIHSPLNNQTYHMFNDKVFKKMKKTAGIINVARGAVVDENALIKALDEKEISFAALDVMEQEPPNVDNPLLKRDNVIITPHIGWSSIGALQKLQTVPAEEVVRVLTGEKPKHLVNKEIEHIFKD